MVNLNSDEIFSSFNSILENIVVSQENNLIKENLKKEISFSFNLGNINKYLDELSHLISVSTTENTKIQKAFIDSLKNNISELFKSIEQTENNSYSDEKIDHQMTNNLEYYISEFSSSVDKNDARTINEFIVNLTKTISIFKETKEKEKEKLKKQIDNMKEYTLKTEEKFRRLNFILEKKNKELITDKLTNVFNRRAYENFKKDFKFKDNASIAITDIDNFKKINDTYGHLNGDMALKAIANVLFKNVDNNGSVFRYGGEEFVIIFNCSDDKAFVILNNIKTYLNSNKFKINHNNNDEFLNLTLSFGFKSITKKDTIDISYEEADKNLYIAKNTGKNKIIGYLPE